MALLANTRIDFGFNQGPSMNGTNFKIVFRCCGKNVLKAPADDDSEVLVSYFGTLEDAMLSLPITCYCHRLKFIVMLGTHTGNVIKFIKNRLLHPSTREEEPDFDYIRLCSPHQSNLNSCLGCLEDDQYISFAMNRDEVAHELSFNIIKATFHHFINRNRYYFNAHSLIGQQTLID